MSNHMVVPHFLPNVALLPQDFPDRLGALKELSGLSWERMAAAMGADSRQLHRWRRGTVPSGEGMLSLVRLAARLPGGLAVLLDEDALDVAGRGKG